MAQNKVLFHTQVHLDINLRLCPVSVKLPAVYLDILILSYTLGEVTLCRLRQLKMLAKYAKLHSHFNSQNRSDSSNRESTKNVLTWSCSSKSWVSTLLRESHQTSVCRRNCWWSLPISTAWQIGMIAVADFDKVDCWLEVGLSRNILIRIYI